jgi:hypothetical protein
MSRYHLQAGLVTYAYGYDRPLQEYFLQKHTPRKNGYPKVTDLVGSCSGKGYGTNYELLEAVTKLKLVVPEDHLLAIQSDLPF